MVIRIENVKTDEVKLLHIRDIVSIDFSPANDDFAEQLVIETKDGFKFIFIDYANCSTLYDILDKYYEDEYERAYVDVEKFRINDEIDNKMFIHLDEGVEH